MPLSVSCTYTRAQQVNGIQFNVTIKKSDALHKLNQAVVSKEIPHVSWLSLMKRWGMTYLTACFATLVKLVNKSHDKHWSSHMTRETLDSKMEKTQVVLMPQQREVNQCSLFSVSLLPYSKFSLQARLLLKPWWYSHKYTDFYKTYTE